MTKLPIEHTRARVPFGGSSQLQREFERALVARRLLANRQHGPLFGEMVDYVKGVQ